MDNFGARRRVHRQQDCEQDRSGLLSRHRVINGAIALDPASDSFRRIALKARRVLVLSVDGQSAADPALSKQRIVTGLG